MFQLLMMLIVSLLPQPAYADPCAKAYVPGQSGEFLETRLKKGGIHLVEKKSEEDAWFDLVEKADLRAETKDFDLVDKHVFTRRLASYSAAELSGLYPDIHRKKLAAAKKEMDPCAR